MLSQLVISDFAIIRHLEIDFKNGLNILSGETGAGKSIIISAVNLILGGRASTDLIRSGAGEARVEAFFSNINNNILKRFMSDSNLPFDGDLLIKRTISREGRNKILINGSLTILQTLSSIGAMIISISGQHEHQLLLRPDNHLYLLDEFGDLTDERNDLSETFYVFESLKEKKQRLEKEIARDKEKQELSLFQIKEIEEADIKEGEDINLEEEKNRLRHAEQIKEIMNDSYVKLYDRENSIISEIYLCIKNIEQGSRLDSRLLPIKKILESVSAELEETSFQLRDLKDDVIADPLRLEAVDDRIHMINKLKRKYGLTIEEIFTTRKQLSESIRSLDEKESELTEVTLRLNEQIDDVIKRADKLSIKRKKAADKINKAVEDELNQLDMAGTGFEVRFYDKGHEESNDCSDPLNGVGPEGRDKIEFLISPNVGEELRPLARIASGGELSRIMLSLKTILAKKSSVETVIFDEVDSGIGGATAEIVGEKLRALSRYHQILCITHLPQIACKGDNHYLVKKYVKDDRTQTEIAELDKDDRIKEIARLLGGKIITDQAIAHARVMMG